MIYGETQIKAFHESMKVMPRDVPRAKHLYIGFIPDSDVTADLRETCEAVIDGWTQHHEETSTQRDRRMRLNTSLSILGFHPPDYYDLQQDYYELQQNVVGGIISQHSGTLQTLSYLTPVININFQMFGWLSSLRNLTIVCLRYKSTFYDNVPLHRIIRFPRLECLHLSYFNTEPLFKYEKFDRVAPNLTHLRLSGRKCYPQLEKLPPRTKVLVQMILMSSQEQRAQISHMRKVLSHEPYSQRITLLEPGHREEGRYGFFDALLDWLDVSFGGNAFWDAANQVTISQLADR